MLTKIEQTTLVSQLEMHLEELRAKLGMSQEDLAAVLGLSRQTYHRICAGKAHLTWRTYLALMFIFENHYATRQLVHKYNLYPHLFVNRLNTMTEICETPVPQTTIRLVFTDYGMMHINPSQRPSHTEGIPIDAVGPQYEEVIQVVTLEEMKKYSHLVMVTKNGSASKICVKDLLDEVEGALSTGTGSYRLGAFFLDALAAVTFTQGDGLVTLITADGKVATFSESLIPLRQPNQLDPKHWAPLISLGKELENQTKVVAATPLRGDEEHLVIFTENGYAKRIAITEIVQRFGNSFVSSFPEVSGTQCIELNEQTGTVIDGVATKPGLCVYALTVNDSYHSVWLDDIPVSTKQAQAEKVFELNPGEYVDSMYIEQKEVIHADYHHSG